MRPAGPLILVAHGSHDPRSAVAVRRLAAAVGARWPAPVTAAFLEADRPDPVTALRALAGPTGRPAVVVPALLTAGYHGRVDLPAALRRSGVDADLAPVLGPAGPGDRPASLLLNALRWQLSVLDIGYDGVALLAAGSRDPAARSTVDDVACALSVAVGLPCVAGFATGAPTGAEATARLRALGARRVVAVPYFVAPGRLCDTAAASAEAAGALAVAAPLADAPALADLVALRARGSSRSWIESGPIGPTFIQDLARGAGKEGRHGGAPAVVRPGRPLRQLGPERPRVRVSGRGPEYLRGA